MVCIWEADIGTTWGVMSIRLIVERLEIWSSQLRQRLTDHLTQLERLVEESHGLYNAPRTPRTEPRRSPAMPHHSSNLVVPRARRFVEPRRSVSPTPTKRGDTRRGEIAAADDRSSSDEPELSDGNWTSSRFPRSRRDRRQADNSRRRGHSLLPGLDGLPERLKSTHVHGPGEKRQWAVKTLPGSPEASECDVEAILAYQDGLYRVRWKGFDKRHDRWLRRHELNNAAELVERFRRDYRS